MTPHPLDPIGEAAALAGLLRALHPTPADEPLAAPGAELLDLAGRVLHSPSGGGRPGQQALVALAGALLRVLSLGDVPPDLARQLPPALRQLHVAVALGRDLADAACQIERLLDEVAAAVPGNRLGTMCAVMQALNGVLALQTLDCTQASSGEAAAAGAAMEMLLVLRRLQDRREPLGVGHVLLRAVSQSVLVVTARASASAPFRAATHALAHRLAAAAASPDVAPWCPLIAGDTLKLVQLLEAGEEDIGALGIIHALHAIRHDLQALAALGWPGMAGPPGSMP